jgi:hypothetical protein
MVAEENVMYREDRRVIVAGRNFLCPKCNKIFQSFGNHSTRSVKALKKRFPKDKLRQFRAALAEAERKAFRDTFDGKRIPKDGEIERWLAILSELP